MWTTDLKMKGVWSPFQALSGFKYWYSIIWELKVDFWASKCCAVQRKWDQKSEESLNSSRCFTNTTCNATKLLREAFDGILHDIQPVGSNKNKKSRRNGRNISHFFGNLATEYLYSINDSSFSAHFFGFFASKSTRICGRRSVWK